MQENRNSIANALELHLSCTNPLIYAPLDHINKMFFFSVCIGIPIILKRQSFYVYNGISFADKTLWLFWMRPAPGFPRDDGHSMPFLWRWHWHYQSYGFSTQIFSLDAFMQKHICLIGSKDVIGCVRLMCQVAVWDRLLHSPSLVAVGLSVGYETWLVCGWLIQI